MSARTHALHLKTKTAKRGLVNLASEQNGILLLPTIKVMRFFIFSCVEFQTSILKRHWLRSMPFSTEMV